MATRPVHQQGEGQPAQGLSIQDRFENFLAHVVENPILYVIAIVFVGVVLLIATLVNLGVEANVKGVSTDFARALDREDVTAQVAALEDVSKGRGRIAADALYLRGELAIRADDPATARTSFEQLRSTHPDYEFTPDAVEGLGFLEEEEGNYEQAIRFYREVQNSWPDYFAARRQPYNIGRCQEKLGQYEEAKESYEAQLDIFPNSRIAARAQSALNELRAKRPDLFPEPELAQETLEIDQTPAGVIPEVELDPPDVDPSLEPAPDTPPESEAPAPADETEDAAPQPAPADESDEPAEDSGARSENSL